MISYFSVEFFLYWIPEQRSSSLESGGGGSGSGSSSSSSGSSSNKLGSIGRRN